MAERDGAFTPGPWHFDGVCQIVEAGRPHMRVAFLPSDHAEYATSKANGKLIAAAPRLFEACEAAEKWLSGWASAEPYLTTIKTALAAARTQGSE